MLKAYLVLTKSGIVVFALLSALAGYAVSLDLHLPFDPWAPVFLIAGLYFVSAGSFAVNQAQEWRVDQRMRRTQSRPIPKGLIAPWQAYILGAVWWLVGVGILWALGPWPAGLAIATIFLYNVVYTLWWKKKWIFGAVPGAIPGAMPVLIGYSVNSSHILAPDCVYLFLVLFLWQMPHFWSLALRFKEDYRAGGLPVLPVELGDEKTRYHIGLYLFAYVGVAIAAPLFLTANLLYLIVVLPISAKLVWEFFRYFKSTGEKSWLPFFLWVNFSLIVYLAVPVVDKWIDWMVKYA